MQSFGEDGTCCSRGQGGSITGTAPKSQTGLIRTFERLSLVVITMCKLMKLGTKNAGRD
jgi:hypothetical protein